MKLEELEKKYAELGAEIERLKKRQDVEIEYAFSVFVSNTFREKHRSVWAFSGALKSITNDIINHPRTVLSPSGFEEKCSVYGFSRCYISQGELFVVANNGGEFEDLNTIEDCHKYPAAQVQAQHKEIIRKYLAERTEESRTFKIGDVDAAWKKYVEAMGFEFEFIGPTGTYWDMGKKYPISANDIKAVDNDGDITGLGSHCVVTLSPAFYQALKPHLDLSKAIKGADHE